MVHHHGNTEYVAVEFGCSGHVGKVESAPVGEFRYFYGRVYLGFAYFAILSGLVVGGDSYIIVGNGGGKLEFAGEFQTVLAVAFESDGETCNSFDIDGHIVDHAVVAHGKAEVKGGIFLEEYGHFCVGSCFEYRCGEVAVEGHQHSLLGAVSGYVDDGDENIETVADHVVAHTDAVVEVVFGLGFTVDVDEIDGLVDVEFGTAQCDGRDSVGIGNLAGEVHVAAIVGHHMIGGHCEVGHSVVYYIPLVVIARRESEKRERQGTRQTCMLVVHKLLFKVMVNLLQ